MKLEYKYEVTIIAQASTPRIAYSLVKELVDDFKEITLKSPMGNVQVIEMKLITAWMDTAAQNQRNTDYYRALVVRCGQAIGRDAYIQDDGNEADEVLCAKVPELVEALCQLRPVPELNRADI